MIPEGLAIHGGPAAVERPLTRFSGIGAAEAAAATRVIEEGVLSGFYGSPQPRFFGGAEVQAFEAEWCERFDVTHAVSVNSCTSGLIAAMGAIGIGPGDEVIIPPYTMSATAVAPLFYGGIPVFADIEADYFCIDPRAVESKITDATRAIIAVNLFGHPAELAELRAVADRHKLFLIEDNAQAVLASEGDRLCATVGDIGVYSLNVHKHIQTGEGGMCVTANADLAKRLSAIRNHGENAVEWLGFNDITNLIGLNFRMAEYAAAMGRTQLKRVDELVGRCERIAGRLTEGLSDLPGLIPPAVRDGCRHNYFMWTMKFDAEVVGTTRGAFSQALAAEKFPCAEGYVKPLYYLPLFQRRTAIGRDGFPFTLRHCSYSPGLCPVVEDMHFSRVIQFQPVSWDADDEQVEMLIAAVHKVHARADSLPATDG